MPAMAAPTTNQGNILGGREFPQVTWYTDPGLRKLYFLLSTVILVSATNGFDGSMMNGLQTLSYWQNYFHPTNAQLGLLNAIMSVGSIVAVPFSPFLSDWRGRRVAIMIGLFIMFIGVALQSAAQNLGMFIGARFLIGFGISFAHGAAPLLVTELAHMQHRARITSIYNTTWYLGAIIAAWTTFGTLKIKSDWAWRTPSILQAGPACVMICFIWFVPESPRWLISVDRHEEALAILAKYHANGNLDDDLVRHEFIEIKETIALEKEFNQQKISVLWSTKGNRHRMFICLCAGLFSQWSGNSLVSYYIALILDQVGIHKEVDQNLINGCLQIWNMIVAGTMAFMVDRFGRRPLFLASTGGMLACFIAWTICSERRETTGNEAAGRAVVAMIYLYYTCYNLAWSGLLVGYTVEILPFQIRAKGLAVMFFFVNCALFFNNYVNPEAINSIKWKYYIVYDCWLGLELAVVYFFFIETRYTPLEEIAKYFDGEDAKVGGDGATGHGKELLNALHEDGKLTDDKVTVEHVQKA
ncbi:uncharacterized protein DFL_006543 [Arthrobotrys flagrans]|uniref:Major facilitator superfamily (MFS) profile domain-containing protein n=1 Tax=Arthrobotrys flagrans TaxID=97331 RepID=A0A436ZT57_ARTFL|nr:hypothetical protein DFL_006543 [Arthrobotrys flagrans]